MVRSLRSISKEDACSLLADSGISLCSPTSSETQHLDRDVAAHNEQAIIDKLCLSDEEAAAETNDDGITIIAETANNATTEELGDVYEVTILPYDDITTISIDEEDSPQKCKFETFIVPDTPAASIISESNSVCSSKRSRKAYICDVCQKEFGGNSDLKRHLLIHSNERPFRCTDCGKCYRQAINLRNHIKIAHNKEKTFDCSVCSKSFALKERLRLHMRIHSGEKPYACQICDKRFARGGQVCKQFA